MKKILASLILCIILLSCFSTANAQQALTKPKVIQISYGPIGHKHTQWNYVKPYVKKNGTIVKGHYRRTK